MNLYDAYMTARDRASVSEPSEALPTLSPVRPEPRRPEPPRPPMDGGCGCEEMPGGPCGGPACRCMPSLAMVYAKPQSFHEMYEAAEGLARGTIFRELDMPLKGGHR